MKNHVGKLDNTIVKNYIAKYLYLIHEYNLIKNKEHPQYGKLNDFYTAHKLDRRNFLKYYHRYQQGKREEDLLPQKRGPKYKTRRPCGYIEQKVIQLRAIGNNRYEIYNLLKPTLKSHTPSPSGIYNILKRHGINRLTPTMKTKKRAIIKERIGQLGHADVHYLSQGIIEGKDERLYLLGIIDDYSRIAWVEVIRNVTSIEVMFAALKSLNILNDQYTVRFEEMMTDNGGEFGRQGNKKKQEHPFERLLVELGIKHRYTHVRIDHKLMERLKECGRP